MIYKNINKFIKASQKFSIDNVQLEYNGIFRIRRIKIENIIKNQIWIVGEVWKRLRLKKEK